MKLSAISIYPVKSLGPVALESAEVTSRGLAGDRRWMIVDGCGRFVTRRELPQLARIRMEAEPDGGYRLRSPVGEAVLPVEIAEGVAAPVTVWRDTLSALIVENDASRLISEVAGRALRLAYMPDSSLRAVDAAYRRNDEIVSFADAFPLLVTSEASLAALNDQLETPVPMDRFRPNIVLAGDGLDAWAERGWPGIVIGSLRLRFTKPCVRCIVITQQPESGERLEGNAVPSALRKLGQSGPQGVLFGMNAVAEGIMGRIAVENAVRVSG